MDLFDFIIGLESTFDARGRKAYIMFHGTTLRKALLILENGFVPSSGGMLGPGVYVTRSFQKASAYPRHLPPGEERAILKLRVHVGRVKRISYQGHPLQYTWHLEGYDTAWVPPNCGMVASGLEEDCVWDPRRIEVVEVLDRNGYPMGFSNFRCPLHVSQLPMYEFPCPTPIGPYIAPMANPFQMIVHGRYTFCKPPVVHPRFWFL